MPYENEYAGYKSLRRLVESERVKQLLGTYRLRDHPSEEKYVQTIKVEDLEISDWVPDWVLAVDGSHAEVRIENGYPGAEASYVTVASVLLDVEKMTQLDQHRPVDPREFRKTEQADSIDCALPGCNIISQGEASARSSLRKALFDVLKFHKMASDGETLLDTYEALLKYKPRAAREQKCPNDDCPVTDAEYKRGEGEYACTCHVSTRLYSADALRIHEGMNTGGTNGAMFAEIMQVLERMWIIHILRTMEAKKWLPILRKLAIVLDGPLAVFGHPAWLSQAIRQELYRLNEAVRAATGGQDILWVGIEKTGTFVDHLNDLDQYETGATGRFPVQSAALLSDEYVKRNVIYSDSPKPYGEDTYFGRKFFYKTKSGALIVAMLPFLSDEDREMWRADPSQYPRLADAMGLLDQLVSSRYPNALAPLVAAHAEAAIPLHLGNRVLERLARELMREAHA